MLPMKIVALNIMGRYNSILSCHLIKRTYLRQYLQKFDDSTRSSIKYSSSDSSSSSSPQKPANCKTINEICGDRVTHESNVKHKCKTGPCAPSQRTSCYPVRPRCGEVKKIQMKETIVEALPLIVEKIDYTKVTCPVSKFEKPSACPTPPGSNNLADDASSGIVDPTFPELPKPPCGPVVLCHCPPPPKLHPGDCPCASATPDTQSAGPTQPCKKFKYSCPEKRIFYCPPRRIIVTEHSVVNQK